MRDSNPSTDAFAGFGLRSDPIELGSEPMRGATVAWLAFPAAAVYYWPSPLAWHIGCRALVRTERATLHLMKLAGAAWTPAHIEAACAAIARADDAHAAHGEAIVEDELADRLGLRSFQIAHPVLRPADLGEIFFVRMVARAIAHRHLRLPDDQRARPAYLQRVEGLQQAFEQALRERVARFIAQWADPQCAHLAGAAGPGLDLALYDDLLLDPTRRNRRQFAVSYPAWAPLAARRGGADGAWLHAQIDAGRPIVEGLARRFGVRPAAIRSALRQPPDCGPLLSLRELVALLDALPRECHPGQPHTWRRFEAMVGVAERCFESLRSPAAIAWLREALKPSRAVARIDEPSLTVHGARIAYLEVLLARHLVLSARAAPRPRSLVRDARRLARRFLASLPPGRQGEIATAVEQALPSWANGQHAASSIAGRAIIDAAAAMPAWRSRDGRRVLAFICDEVQLRSIGIALDNCLAHPPARADHAARLAAGLGCYVAVSDGHSGALLSVAELSLAAAGGAAAKVLSHRAARNNPPSAACRAAVQEAAERLASLPRDPRARAAILRMRRQQHGSPDWRQIARRFVAGFGKARFLELRRALLEINAAGGAHAAPPPHG